MFLTQESFDLHLLPSDPVSLVPMHLGVARFTIGNSHAGDTFEFSPPSFAKLATQPHDIPYASTNRDSLDNLNPADNLEMHAAV
jgi:hypothetical protein